MVYQPVSACYHPTTVVFVDDNIRYLRNIRSQLIDSLYLFKLFEKPVDALHFLTEEYKPTSFTEQCVIHPEEDRRDHRHIEVITRALHKTMFNPDRFDTVSVVVVDQVMPVMTGLELCKMIRHLPFKILLLTGETSNSEAVEAFNNNLIDKFISKDTPNFEATFKAAVDELQKAYFRDQSNIIMDSIVNNPEHHPASCLADPAFIQFFEEFCKKNSFTEYYIADAEGSFFLLDMRGKLSLLVVNDEESMFSTYQLAEFADIQPPADIMQALKNKEKIIYLYSPHDLRLDPHQWHASNYLYPAKYLQGKQQKYYYSWVKQLEHYDIPFEDIFSFRKCLQALGR